MHSWTFTKFRFNNTLNTTHTMRPSTSPMKQLLSKIQTDEWKQNALKQNIGLSDIEALLKPTRAKKQTKAKRDVREHPENKAPTTLDNGDGKRSGPSPSDFKCWTNHPSFKTHHPMEKREPFDSPSMSKAKRDMSLMQDPAIASAPFAKFESLKLYERTSGNKRRKLASEPIEEMQLMSVTRSSGKKFKLGWCIWYKCCEQERTVIVFSMNMVLIFSIMIFIKMWSQELIMSLTTAEAQRMNLCSSFNLLLCSTCFLRSHLTWRIREIGLCCWLLGSLRYGKTSSLASTLSSFALCFRGATLVYLGATAASPSYNKYSL